MTYPSLNIKDMRRIIRGRREYNAKTFVYHLVLLGKKFSKTNNLIILTIINVNQTQNLETENSLLLFSMFPGLGKISDIECRFILKSEK